MTRYFVFLYDSLIHTFSVLDAGDTVSFQFAAQNASNVFEGLKAGDLILGCPHTDTVRARLLLEVVSVNADKSITLNKKAEIENGAEVSIGEKLDTLKAKSLCEITWRSFRKF